MPRPTPCQGLYTAHHLVRMGMAYSSSARRWQLEQQQLSAGMVWLGCAEVACDLDLQWQSGVGCMMRLSSCWCLALLDCMMLPVFVGFDVRV